MQASEGSRSFLETISMLYRDEGIARFYRGAIPIMLGCLPAHAAFFATYEFTRSKFYTNDSVQLDTVHTFRDIIFSQIFSLALLPPPCTTPYLHHWMVFLLRHLLLLSP